MIHYCTGCGKLNGHCDDCMGCVCWGCKRSNFLNTSGELVSGQKLEKTEVDVLKEEVERLTKKLKEVSGAG